MSRGHSGQETTQRLLAAAAEVFTEVGYRGATLREICRRAGANIAAVNYHFRDKEQLYEAVINEAVVAAGGGLALLVAPPTDSPQEKLRHFICGFLHNLLGADRPVQLLRLMAHESVESTPALDLVVAKAARPLHETLCGIVQELLGPQAPAGLVRDCAVSVLAQCATFHHSEAIVQRLHEFDVHDPATIDRLAEHVFRFSLGAIRAMAAAEAPAGCL